MMNPKILWSLLGAVLILFVLVGAESLEIERLEARVVKLEKSDEARGIPGLELRNVTPSTDWIGPAVDLVGQSQKAFVEWQRQNQAILEEAARLKAGMEKILPPRVR